MLDDKGIFDNIFFHVWAAASLPTQQGYERLDWLIKSEKFSANQKTLIGQNTPLHFAVINENLKAIEILCRNNDVRINEKNSVGQTP